MSKTISPCYNNGSDCINRTSTCHIDCKAWKLYEEAHKKEMEEIHKNRIPDRSWVKNLPKSHVIKSPKW